MLRSCGATDLALKACADATVQGLLMLAQRNHGPRRYCQIVTDIDDTLFPNPMYGIAGRDYSQARYVPYPGVHSVGQATLPLPILLLSARPTIFLSKARAAMALGRHADDLYAAGGNVSSLRAVRGLLGTPRRQTYSTMAQRKAEVLARYATYLRYAIRARAVQDEVELVFLGDTGQGDLEAAARALDAGHIQQAFIHNVGCLRGETPTTWLFQRPQLQIIQNFGPVLDYVTRRKSSCDAAPRPTAMIEQCSLCLRAQR